MSNLLQSGDVTARVTPDKIALKLIGILKFCYLRVIFSYFLRQTNYVEYFHFFFLSPMAE